MKAVLTHKRHSGNVAKNRKERVFYKQYTVVTSDLTDPIQLRLYKTEKSHYACIWIHDSNSKTHLCGGGRSIGYGYHRASDAAENALQDVGVCLSEGVGGAGDQAIIEALKAIAVALGYDRVLVTEAFA